MESVRTESREVGEELQGIAQDLRALLRSEMELARAEMREDVQAATRVAIWGAVAALAGTIGVVFAALTAMYGLDHVVPLWVAALIVAAALLLVAVVSALLAKSQLGRISVVPQKTVASVKEDVSWAKAQMKSRSTSNASANP
jgi:hypothetical protein